MEKIIKLEAEIDMTTTPNETRVKAVDGPWEDFGYFLEITGFLAYQAMREKEWTTEQMTTYISDYISNCLIDYKVKR